MDEKGARNFKMEAKMLKNEHAGSKIEPPKYNKKQKTKVENGVHGVWDEAQRALMVF